MMKQSSKSVVLRGWVLGSVVLLLTACASPQSGGRGGNLTEILNQARQSPAQRATSVADCERWTQENGTDFPFEAFFAGLLGVDEQAGGHAFCAALVEAAVSGDFSQEEQNAFRLPSEIRGKGPAGALLREVLIAHERLMRRQAKSPAAAAGAPGPAS